MAAPDELPAEVEALRKVPFFSELTPADLERIARIGERRSYAPGDAIVTRDTATLGLFIILSGTVTLEAGGKTHTLGPGAFFGEMALLGGTRRSATVTASEPVEAMAIETIYFRPFLIQNPSLAVTVLEGVVERLREVQERLEQTGGG
jgi:CRP-like cAMP-binding protein